jgi:hypothetical protein
MSEEKFSPSETGLSHPLTQCAVRLTDDGRICIMAGDSCGIVLDQETGVITLYGTEIRFATDEVMIDGKKIRPSSLEPKRQSKTIGKQIRMMDRATEER